MKVWILALALLGALGALGCEDAARSVQSRQDAVAPPVLDAEPVRDGLVIFEDFGRLTPDAGLLPCETGRISGIVCAPSGAPIAGARVVVATTNCDGSPRNVELDANDVGYFVATDLPPGPTTVTVRQGSFHARWAVDVQANRTVPVNRESEKICLDAEAAHIAVFTGDYDRVQEVLDGLGFSYDLYCGDRRAHRGARSLLADWDALREYDILFVNCTSGIDLGHQNAEVRTALENLRKFVQQGGSVYVSDLSADFIRRGWPDWVGFDAGQSMASTGEACCTCVEGACAAECSIEPTPPLECSGCCPEPNPLPLECRFARNGTTGGGQSGDVNARITSPFLRRYFNGNSALQIWFNLGGWVPIVSVRPGVEVLVESLAGQPLMVIFSPEPDGGRVAYTSFHNHAQASEAIQTILEALIFRL